MGRFLIADIGGTNARLQLLETEGITIEIVAREHMLVRSFPNLQACLLHFLKDREPPSHCVLAVPGLIDNHKVWQGGTSWPRVTSEELSSLGFSSVVFLNDLEAAGYGVLQLGHEQLISLNTAGVEERGAPKVLISVGTGLGTCFLTAKEGVYTAWHSEGGGCYFCPKNRLQEAYAGYVSRQIGELIRCGKVVAQATAWHMYGFFLREEGNAESVPIMTETEDIFHSFLSLGLQGQDCVYEKCAVLYTSIIGGIAGDWATRLLPKGGVYLLGGVLQNNAQGFQNKSDILMQAFLSRPARIRQTLATIPVFLVKPEVTAGLLGAQWFALHGATIS